MSDYESDGDEHNYNYADEGLDENEVPDLGENQNNNGWDANNNGWDANNNGWDANNNGWGENLVIPPNLPNPANPANPANPNDPTHLLNEKKKEFDGSNNFKNNWTQCFYCAKYHPGSMHLPGVNYCGHCWGWLNSDQLKLTEGTYNGPNTIDEVKNFLKLTYPLHPNTCTNVECVYNKIKQFAESKTLHLDFCVELGFEKKEKNPEKNPDKNNNLEYHIKKNKHNTRINYKLSSITI
jgi:hypothetical protein